MLEDKMLEFHKKYGMAIAEPFPKSCPGVEDSATSVEIVARRLSLCVAPGRLQELRCHLLCEELAEYLHAAAVGDRVAALDALADLIYVAVGTATSFGLPIEDAFAEVHRSNMTKTVEQDRPGHPGKGEGYSPPDIQGLLFS